MKMRGCLPLLVLFFFAMAGCESMDDMLTQAAGSALEQSVDDSKSAVSSGGMEKLDFKEGEILVAYEGSSRDDANYRLAKVLTEASSETNGEGEFLILTNGESVWTPWFFDSYVPDQDELELGMKVLYCYDALAHFSELDSESYRTSTWYIGRITETDELYKGVIGIRGKEYQVSGVRLPVEPFD